MGNKKKRIISLVIIIVVVILLAVIWYVSSTQWTRDFSLRYVDNVLESERGNHSGQSYALYEITNNTNHTLKDVSVIIFVDNVYGDFEYEDRVTSSIKPGQTVEYRLYANDYKTEANARGVDLFLPSIDIVEIEYSR